MTSKTTEPNRFIRIMNVIGPASAGLTIVGVLFNAATPDLIPENTFTLWLGQFGNYGLIVLWMYLLSSVLVGIDGIYGPDSAEYLRKTPLLKIIGQVVAAYGVAIVCFAIAFVHISRGDDKAFSEALNLGNGLYFSIATITTTGYGDIFPKSALARVCVCSEILFGFLYTILFFSIFAGLAGRTKPDVDP